jgi:hypothetical protein
VLVRVCGRLCVVVHVLQDRLMNLVLDEEATFAIDPGSTMATRSVLPPEKFLDLVRHQL